MAKSISVPITGNAAPLRKALAQASNDLNTFGNKAGAAAKKTAIAMTAIGAAGALVTLKWTKMAELAMIADKRIERVARSMVLFGADTGMVTKRIQDYADAMERETGVTAETIKAAQAKLLTFRQLALTADKAGGAFDRATQATVDMAAAGFGEATTNAVQLGKALEDPIKGVNSLRRSGITFTESEKARLAVLVETNRMHEAQNVILTAVETQVKGVASSTALSTARMKNGFGEVTDRIGTELLPIMNGLADALVKIGEKATLNGLGAAFKELGNQASLALDGMNEKLGRVMRNQDGTVNGFGRFRNALTRTANGATHLVNGFKRFTNAIGITDEKLFKVTNTLSGYTEAEKKAIVITERMNAMDKIRAESLQKEADAKALIAKQNELATAKAQENAAKKEAADAKEREGFKAFKDRLIAAQDAVRAYVAGIATAISANVSLSNAFSQAATSEEDASTKLREATDQRKNAYEELYKAQRSTNPNDYADALDNVANAEKAVKDAKEVKPKNYLAIFKEQIQAAKDFGKYLQQLISGGQMSPAAIQQMLDLGPVAGAQVAKEMLTGTAGITASSLSSDLAAVSAAGTAAGMATPGFQNTLDAQAVNGAGTGNYYITIEAGMGDPTAIAKTVTEVLQTYGEKIGGVPIKVKTPKASPAKKPPRKK